MNLLIAQYINTFAMIYVARGRARVSGGGGGGCAGR